jgi:hypothetical protein
MSNPTRSQSVTALLPSILTAFAVVVGIAFAIYFPSTILALYLVVLPVPLILLWLARDVATPQERIAAVDAERRQMRMSAHSVPGE